MISVSQCDQNSNNGIIVVKGRETISCPHCNGRLRVRGTCTRKVRAEFNTKVYRLRVFQCTNENCRKTHRELPDFIVPYKRYGTETVFQYATCNGNNFYCEISTWLILKAWFRWFISYAQNILKSLELRYGFIPKPPVNQDLANFKFLVRLVVNSNFWQQHRSAMT